MPIYEYSCGRCGKITEFLIGVGQEDPKILCAGCGSAEMTKVMSAPNLPTAASSPVPGGTCCGNEERCSTPSCAAGEACRSHHH